MAKRHFLIPKTLIRKLPSLHHPAWLLEAFFLLGIIKTLRLFSPERGERIARTMLGILGPLMPFQKKMQENLQRAFPDKNPSETRQITKEAGKNLGSAFADLVYAGTIWRERDARIQFQFEDDIDLSSYANKPVVLVTGHIGAWQIAPFVGRSFQLQLTSIFAPEKNPYIVNFMHGLRKTLQPAWVPRDGCMKHLIRELKADHAIGLATDTRIKDGLSVPFFNLPFLANTAAARLAIRANSDLVPIRCERLPGMRYNITVCKPITSSDRSNSKADQVTEITAAMIAVYQSWIEEDPTQWMCFSRRWAKRR